MEKQIERLLRCRAQIELTPVQMEAMRKLMLEGDPDGIFTFYDKDGKVIKPISE